jgi:hypothetical protein
MKNISPLMLLGENKWFRKQCFLYRHQEGVKRRRRIAPLILNPGASLLCELKRENNERCNQNPEYMNVKKALAFARVNFMLHPTNAVTPFAWSQW